MIRPFMVRACMTVAALSLVMLPVQAHACSYFGQPLSEAQIDESTRKSVGRLQELFEAEVLKTDGANSEMRVIRVFRGKLQAGQILRGRPSWSSCMVRELQVGDRGFALLSFGPN